MNLSLKKQNNTIKKVSVGVKNYFLSILIKHLFLQNILRGNLLQLLLRHVDDATAKNLQDPANHWPHLECVLYCWSAVAESLAEEVSSQV